MGAAKPGELCPTCEQVHGGCTAHNRQGGPCGFHTIAGGFVCRFHGGAAPQVRDKARLRILAATDRAAGVMIKLLGSKDERVKLKAAADLLDRAGLGAKVGIELSGPDGTPIEVRARNLADALRDFQAGADTQRSLAEADA